MRPHEETAWLGEARQIVADLRAPRPSIYWPDLVLSCMVAWSAIAIAAYQTPGSSTFAAATIVAGLAFTRAFLFVHEITHMRQPLKGFRLAWNALVGVPLAAPSFLYETVHRDHHRVSIYRTLNDPEHRPDDKTLLQRSAVAVVASLLLPPILVLRFGVIGPLAWLHPRWRRWVNERFSALSANLAYRPSPLTRDERRHATAAEICASLWVVSVTALVATQTIPLRAVVATWLASAIAMAITDLRGEILHRFSSDGPTGTLHGQVRDSVNLPHTGIATALLMPVGIGYHALHHLEQTLPYHAMREAHRRLQTQLAAHTLYHRVTTRGLVAATRQAIADDRVQRGSLARGNRQGGSANQLQSPATVTRWFSTNAGADLPLP